MTDETARLHAIVRGRVQGVGFRFFVEKQANLLNLTGWVRNRWDGTVEVVAEGDRPRLERLLAALQRGPSASRVSEVETLWEEAKGEFKGFSVRFSI